MREIHTLDPAMVTCWATQTECASMFARLAHDKLFSAAQMAASLTRLRAAARSWTEVLPSQHVREQAFRLLRVHRLRAGDALQLAAAVVGSGFQPGVMEFVTLDNRQAEAADKEGFTVVS